MNLGKKAVSATLVGALAVGMVPGVALAANATDEGAADDGINALALTPAQAFSNGKVTGVTVGGKAVAVNNSGSVGVITIAATGSAQTLAVTEVTPSVGKVIDDTTAFGSVTIIADDQYDGADTDWDNATSVSIDDAGTYWAQVKGAGDYVDGAIVVKIVVEGISISGATAYGETTADTTFGYNAAPQTIHFKVGNETLVTDDTSADQTASVVWYKGTGVKAEELETQPADGQGPTGAGTYTARLTGVGQYSGKADVVVTIAPLNLSTANIQIADTLNGAFKITKINDLSATAASGSDFSAFAKLDITAGPDGTLSTTENGKYTFNVEPADDSGNVIGSKSVTANRVASANVTWTLPSATSTTAATTTLGTAAQFTLSDINYQDGDKAFDISTLKAAPTDDPDTALKYTYTVTNAKGEVVPQSSLTKAGVWTVTANVVPSTEASYGSTCTFTVTVYDGTIENKDVILLQDGAVASTLTTPFTGSSVLPDLDITVKSGNKTLVEGTDYTFNIYASTDTGKTNPLDEMVNAGGYVLAIESSNYDVSGVADISVTVNKMEINGLRVTGQTERPDSTEYLPFTDAAIEPVVEYTTSSTQDIADGKATWTALPKDIFTLSYNYGGTTEPADWTTVNTLTTEIKKAGFYQITATPVAAQTGNYTMNGGTVVVEVAVPDNYFADVKVGDWYYDAVLKAAALGYMKGYPTTNPLLFGPNDNITRGQVACVLYQMAGGTYATDPYFTSFSDVDPNGQIAQAIAWAKDAQIVKGYGDSDEFGPNDPISREQFAIMLARYAKAFGLYEAPADIDAVLSACPDADEINDWAKADVAWAVSAKIMGNNGGMVWPSDNLSRAQAAQMAVNFQPEKLPTTSPVA